MKMKFLRTILNKAKKDRKRNNNIKSELGVDQIENDIQKSRLRWFGHVLLKTEKRLPTK